MFSSNGNLLFIILYVSIAGPSQCLSLEPPVVPSFESGRQYLDDCMDLSHGIVEYEAMVNESVIGTKGTVNILVAAGDPDFFGTSAIYCDALSKLSVRIHQGTHVNHVSLSTPVLLNLTGHPSVRDSHSESRFSRQQLTMCAATSKTDRFRGWKSALSGALSRLRVMRRDNFARFHVCLFEKLPRNGPAENFCRSQHAQLIFVVRDSPKVDLDKWILEEAGRDRTSTRWYAFQWRYAVHWAKLAGLRALYLPEGHTNDLLIHNSNMVRGGVPKTLGLLIHGRLKLPTWVLKGIERACHKLGLDLEISGATLPHGYNISLQSDYSDAQFTKLYNCDVPVAPSLCAGSKGNGNQDCTLRHVTDTDKWNFKQLVYHAGTSAIRTDIALFWPHPWVNQYFVRPNVKAGFWASHGVPLLYYPMPAYTDLQPIGLTLSVSSFRHLERVLHSLVHDREFRLAHVASSLQAAHVFSLPETLRRYFMTACHVLHEQKTQI